MGESLWRDEIDTIRFAQAPLADMTRNLTQAGFNGPAYLLIIKAWLSVGGVNDLSLRYFSLLCGVLQVAVLYAFLRLIFPKRVGRYAFWLIALSPVLAWYSGEGKMYSLQLLLITIAFYALRRGALSQGARLNVWWLLSALAASLGYYVHLLTPFFLPVAVFFVIAWWPQTRHHWRGALVAGAVCTIPYLPLALWQIPAVLQGYETGHPFYPFNVMIFTLAYNWSLGLSDAWLNVLSYRVVLCIILLYTCVAVLGLVVMLMRPQRFMRSMGTRQAMSIGQRPAIMLALSLLAWLLLPAALIYAISTRVPVFEARYVLWSVPAFYILAGVGCVWVAEPHRWAGRILIIILSVVEGLGWVAQVVYPIRPDLRGASRLVASTLQSDDLYLVLIPYARYGIEYYVPQLVPEAPLEPGLFPVDGLRTVEGLRERIIDAPYTNAGARPDDVSVQLLPYIQRNRRIWLIETEASMWDQRGLVSKWLDDNMQVLEKHQLHEITLTLYQTR